MHPGRKALMMVAGRNGPPSIEAAAQQLHVAPDAIDRDFGIVPIDPAKNTYSVLVETADETPNERSFSNPKIEPFRK
jgi:hypothetical protein